VVIRVTLNKASARFHGIEGASTRLQNFHRRHDANFAIDAAEDDHVSPYFFFIR
jgi:hypothetical protein